MNIVLIEPKMPSNTGNIIRLCANTNVQLHLVGPMPFELEDKKLKRAGLDYREWAQVKTYENWNTFGQKKHLIGCSTRAQLRYDQYSFQLNDWLVFGSEDQGISEAVRQEDCWKTWLRIPMQSKSRSLNLANSVAIIVFEALRQHAFPDLE